MFALLLQHRNANQRPAVAMILDIRADFESVEENCSAELLGRNLPECIKTKIRFPPYFWIRKSLRQILSGFIFPSLIREGRTVLQVTTSSLDQSSAS